MARAIANILIIIRVKVVKVKGKASMVGEAKAERVLEAAKEALRKTLKRKCIIRRKTRTILLATVRAKARAKRAKVERLKPNQGTRRPVGHLAGKETGTARTARK